MTSAAFTKKLKLAIKAKIQELGVDADDELPDYVMVLVANRKNKPGMKEHLQLFMGKNTAVFVDWLFEAFERIQKGIPSQSQFSESQAKPQPSTEPEVAVGRRRCNTRSICFSSGEVPFSEEDEKEKKKKNKKDKKDKHHTPERKGSDDGFLRTFKQVEGPKVGRSRKESEREHRKHPRIAFDEEKVEKSHTKPKKEKKHSKHKKKRRTSPEVYEKGRKKFKSSKYEATSEEFYSDEEEQEEEEQEQVVKNVFRPKLRSQLGQIIKHIKNDRLSPIRTLPPRPNSRHSNHSRPPSRPSSRLDYRDEDEQEVITPPPRQLVNTRSTIFQRALGQSSTNQPTAHLNTRMTLSQNPGMGRKVIQENEGVLKVQVERKEISTKVVDSVVAGTSTATVDVRSEETVVRRKRRADDPARAVAILMGIDKPKIKRTLPVEDPENKPDDKDEPGGDSERSTSKETTGSVSRSSLYGWNGQITIDESSSEDEAEIDKVVASTATETRILSAQLPPTAALSRPQLFATEQRALQLLNAQTAALQSQGISIKERCRFWPNCTKGPTCPYLHPAKPCIKFPFCTFGNKCLYIHPMCKFGVVCKKPNCPYTHDERTFGLQAPMLHQASIPALTPLPRHLTLCKFQGWCENQKCEFKHPAPCRFGMACTNAHCTFLHRNPDMSTFNWGAPKPT